MIILVIILTAIIFGETLALEAMRVSRESKDREIRFWSAAWDKEVTRNQELSEEVARLRSREL